MPHKGKKSNYKTKPEQVDNTTRTDRSVVLHDTLFGNIRKRHEQKKP